MEPTLLTIEHFLLTLLLLAGSLFLSIPRTLSSIKKLKDSHSPTDFGEAAFWVTTSFSLLSIPFIAWIRFYLNLHLSRSVNLFISAILFYLTFYVFLPHSYKLLKKRITSKTLSYAILLWFISLFSIAVTYARAILPVFGVQNE
jgi:hypothetical protein